MIKTYNKAEGTYLMWIDVSQVAEKIGAKDKAAAETKAGKPTTSEQIVERWFIKHAGVALNPGHTYGPGGDPRSPIRGPSWQRAAPGQGRHPPRRRRR